MDILQKEDKNNDESVFEVKKENRVRRILWRILTVVDVLFLIPIGFLFYATYQAVLVDTPGFLYLILVISGGGNVGMNYINIAILLVAALFPIVLIISLLLALKYKWFLFLPLVQFIAILFVFGPFLLFQNVSNQTSMIAGSRQAEQNLSTSQNVKTEEIWQAPSGAKVDSLFSLAISPDQKSYAVIYTKDNQDCIVVSGEEKGCFDSIKWPEWSLDGKYLTYVITTYDPNFSPSGIYIATGRRGGKEAYVINGVQTEWYPLDIAGISFNPTNNNEYAFVAGDGLSKNTLITQDGKQQVYKADIEDWGWSRNGDLYVHLKSDKIGDSYVINGKQGEVYAGVADIAWGKGFGEYVYRAYSKGVSYFITNGSVKKMPKNEDAYHFQYNQDGTKLAYILGNDDSSAYVVDGQKQKVYDKVFDFVWNKNGTDFAYVAKSGDQEFVVIDGVEQEHFKYDVNIDSGIVARNSLGWGPIEGSFVYMVRDFDFSSGSGGPQFYVVDGKKQLEHKHTQGNFVWSPDGKEFAYIATNSRGGMILDQVLVKNGKIIDKGDVVGDLAWSPDGKHLIYSTFINSREMAVAVDGKEYGRFAHVTDAIFSSDSKEFSFYGFTTDNALIKVTIQL